MPKRKADDSDDEIIVEKDEAKGGKGSKKAKGGDGKEEKKPRGPPKPKVVKLKKFTEVEERVALGASMERNEAIAKFLEGMFAAYKEGVRGRAPTCPLCPDPHASVPASSLTNHTHNTHLPCQFLCPAHASPRPPGRRSTTRLRP